MVRLVFRPYTQIRRSICTSEPLRASTREDPTHIHFHYAFRVCHPNTRTYVRLLGPCFKTGRLKPLRQHP
ncbi:hypothetical protein Glove_335g33 [Diversispora epigaea]|uniref:Uncharacterized protein n=1 Tax=Diversispora epigaea TaxID=1348612 RepID=A0A397HHW5_9GLOM|nr:hypothetical protein Glove_335g33 [Diversispora epigaea]